MLLTCNFTCAQIQQKRDHGYSKILTMMKDWDQTNDPAACMAKLKHIFGTRAVVLDAMLENFKIKNYRERNADPVLLDHILITLFQAQSELDTVCDMVAKLRNGEKDNGDYKILSAFADQHRWQLCRAYFVHATRGQVDVPGCGKILHFLAEHVRTQRFPADVFQHLNLPVKDEADLPKIPAFA